VGSGGVKVYDVGDIDEEHPRSVRVDAQVKTPLASIEVKGIGVEAGLRSRGTTPEPITDGGGPSLPIAV